MASYLRPRRGKKSTAESQALVLKRGEVFFECPDTGVGTGAGKLKVGDGSTAYSSLPYFLEPTDVESSTIGFTDASAATDSSNNATYLTNIKPANSLKTIFTNLKQLLYNYNSQLTQLNNDLSDTNIRGEQNKFITSDGENYSIKIKSITSTRFPFLILIGRQNSTINYTIVGCWNGSTINFNNTAATFDQTTMTINIDAGANAWVKPIIIYIKSYMTF